MSTQWPSEGRHTAASKHVTIKCVPSDGHTCRELVWIHCLLRPGKGAEYCDQFVSLCVCLCVCVWLSASMSRELLDHLHEICCGDPLWPWLGPPLAALRYVMYFWFYGWRHVWPFFSQVDVSVSCHMLHVRALTTVD